MKREINTTQPGDFKKAVSLDSKITATYNGYYPEDYKTSIDVIDVPNTEKEKLNFFDKYVLRRKPCKIIGVSSEGFPLKELQFENIKNTLNENEILQIEKKANGGFGSGNKRLKLKFGEFIDEITKNQQTDLYLTTQYYEDDPENGNYSSDEEEKDQIIDEKFNTNFSDNESLVNLNDLHDDFDELEQCNGNSEDEENVEDQIIEDQLRLKELYQPPMTNLVKTLPETPDFLDYLIPQQINLWVGATSKQDNINFTESFKPDSSDKWMGLGRNIPGDGSSSGLHHDHADNLYIPIDGYKRFTLFSPGDAAKMYLVGDIKRVFNSGLIDYIHNEKAPFWRELRADGAIVAETYKKILNDKSIELDDKQKNEYEDFVRKDFLASTELTDKGTLNTDPASFSTIPPSFIHLDEIENEVTKKAMDELIDKKWPLFKKANRIEVNVKPGEMLYLPTGWFHEVTSYGADNKKIKNKNNVHVSVNYWFIPPDGNSIENIYANADNYWPTDYKRTKEALKRIREAVK
ncbi:hypothetical protein TPHA_0H02900 [Tetrapisispora phaffii CBS 4417]|uniref:JmjC domain-containing protein n=1 Tax=Tetrapisispora phaffii (strain ATCC 24235 / CBS 4417 / NBRC 1672 / NRRL Y-8282 / UCD 70-5) TaxID=1071381 RepID=G8BWP2_TETPH|nr:hypothetical protein TPHA_0H02900 [Tetrapisispora phaffii CBS 4417]CCE64493.1 hypothetical protein TPHA_0H02900 [Tetrapisispora phaffii CBS 4417]